jgi:hypothetical protein
MHLKSITILTVAVLVIGGVIFTTFHRSLNGLNVTPSPSEANYVFSKSKSFAPLLTLSPKPESASIPGNFNYATGHVVSLQENNAHNQTWLAKGSWNLTRTKSTPDTLQNSGAIIFVAKFTTINIDGSLKERYRISNFKLTNALVNKMADVFNGTVSVHGTANYTNVPTTIKIVGNGKDGIITISLNPVNVSSRFGNRPIYGTVDKIA